MKKETLIIAIFLISFVSAQQSLSPSERTGIFILVDNTPPIITILSPQPTNYNNATSLLGNFTIADPSLDSVWYSLNDKENITITSYFYLSLSEGNYNLKIYANDSRNRQNFSEVNFKIDNSIPSPQPPSSASSGSGSGGSGPSGPDSFSKEKNDSSIQNEHNQKEPEKNITKNESSEKNIPPNISTEQQRIKASYQLIFIILILIIIIIIISYKFIKNLNKKRK